MLGLIIDSLEHDVLKGDKVARCELQIVVASCKQLCQWVFSVQRHEPIAQVVIWCMQRNGQSDRAILWQSPYLGHHTRGGNCNPESREPLSIDNVHPLQ